MKILILRFSSLGDIILTTPVIRCLKNQLSDVKIHFASKKSNAFLLKSNPYIDKLHILDETDSSLINNLKSERFDLIVDLHNNVRTLRIKASLKVKSVSFDKLNFRKWLMVNLKINRMPAKHIVDRYFETVAYLGIKNEDHGLDYFIPQQDIIDLGIYGLKVNEYLAYGIGGQHFTKRLPKEKMLELLERIDRRIVLLGGKEDETVANFLQENFGEKVVNLAGQINLNKSAWIIKNASSVISHDTAVMHIAAAFHKNVISIWGNTVPEFGMTPYQTNFRIIENKNLPCRPCSKIGYSACPKGHFKCMKELDFSNFSSG